MCLKEDRWCSGITPVSHTGGSEFDPQSVHFFCFFLCLFFLLLRQFFRMRRYRIAFSSLQKKVPEKRVKKKNCACRESNPDHLLGRQIS